MTQDEIIRMAREAGWPIESGDELPDTGSMNLERFAALVAAHEREACAKVCEESSYSDEGDYWKEQCAAAIRARGEK